MTAPSAVQRTMGRRIGPPSPGAESTEDGRRGDQSAQWTSTLKQPARDAAGRQDILAGVHGCGQQQLSIKFTFDAKRFGRIAELLSTESELVWRCKATNTMTDTIVSTYFYLIVGQYIDTHLRRGTCAVNYAYFIASSHLTQDLNVIYINSLATLSRLFAR